MATPPSGNEESASRADESGPALDGEGFTEAERARLALLHLFQGFVDVDALCAMGHPGADWCLPTLGGLTHAAAVALLDRAAERGLIAAHGGGYYAARPARPWSFKAWFDQYHGDAAADPQRAFVEAMGIVGNYYAKQYYAGNRAIIDGLAAEEANLLQARAIAMERRWPRCVIAAMQGLRGLYEHTGRPAAWRDLVADILPLMVDPATGGPLAGAEEEWSIVVDYRVHIAREARDWPAAAQLQRGGVEWDRQRAAAALAAPPDALDGRGRAMIRALASSLHRLGQIQYGLGEPACVASYQEALGCADRIGDRVSAATCAYTLGLAYKDLPAIRDLGQAEAWAIRSFEWHEYDAGRAKSLGLLGYVAYLRYLELRAAPPPDGGKAMTFLNVALKYYAQSLNLLAPGEISDLGVSHNQLGIIYDEGGVLDRAIEHWNEALRYKTMAGDHFGAGQTRYNIARGLARRGRFAEALPHAEGSLRDFLACGASADAADAQQLIARITADRDRQQAQQ